MSSLTTLDKHCLTDMIRKTFTLKYKNDFSKLMEY